MIVKVADNIFSPIGYTTSENFGMVKEGHSALALHEGLWDIPEPFMASLFPDRSEIDLKFSGICAGRREDYTFFEKISILSAYDAISRTDIDPSSDKVLFILSTTKGNVDLLNIDMNIVDEVLPSHSAERIASFFGNSNSPITVSNACTSGACAQLTAYRMLEAGLYDHAVVIGADVQSKFIVTGFQSFKALSKERCRPFDAQREGLNLGEAAATIIFSRRENQSAGEKEWVLQRGAIHNDANHISGPSRTGEGCYLCLKDILDVADMDNIALINAHGTATPYNDEMESIAIDRAGLSHVPVNGYKGIYGHTMGAAGVLETIISQKSIEENLLLSTAGFGERGVSRDINIVKGNSVTQKSSFIKMLSGFGGCNVALLFKMGE